MHWESPRDNNTLVWIIAFVQGQLNVRCFSGMSTVWDYFVLKGEKDGIAEGKGNNRKD